LRALSRRSNEPPPRAGNAARLRAAWQGRERPLADRLTRDDREFGAHARARRFVIRAGALAPDDRHCRISGVLDDLRGLRQQIDRHAGPCWRSPKSAALRPRIARLGIAETRTVPSPCRAPLPALFAIAFRRIWTIAFASASRGLGSFSRVSMLSTDRPCSTSSHRWARLRRGAKFASQRGPPS